MISQFFRRLQYKRKQAALYLLLATVLFVLCAALQSGLDFARAPVATAFSWLIMLLALLGQLAMLLVLFRKP